jgi:hypothetical protein
MEHPIHPPHMGHLVGAHMDEPEERQRRSVTRRMSEDTVDVFVKLGIDPYDIEALREMAADLYYLRRQRLSHQQRVSMNWTTFISAIASAAVGAFGVLFAEILSRKG